MKEKECIQPSKHLTLYFDINDTMFIGDSAKGIYKNTAIFKLLAERYIAVWDPAVTVKLMSYKHFVEQHLCPGNKRNPEIQQAQIKHYNDFIHFLQSKKHGLLGPITRDYYKMCDHLKQGNIPQSFIELINHLELNQYSYSLVFRTFGEDIEEVEKELTARLSIKDLPKARFESGLLNTEDGSILTNPSQIVTYFKSHKFLACKDSFDTWSKAGERYEGGKRYIVDFLNDQDVSIFFDDNALLKEILCVESLEGDEFEQRLIQEELIKRGRIVPVDTYATCMDVNYFINAVKYAYNTPLELSPELLERSNQFSM